MTQHAELSAARWAQFGLGQQILQIAVELERAKNSLRADRLASLRLSYERVLRIAELYLADSPDPSAHRAATVVLLQLHPVAAVLIPNLDP